MSIELAKALLASPVLVAIVTALVSAVFGRQIVQAKDEQIRAKGETIEALRMAHAAEMTAKNAEIAMLERWTPGRLQEHVDAMRLFFEQRVEQLNNELDNAQRALTQVRENERDRAGTELEQVQLRLAEARRERDASETALAMLKSLVDSGSFEFALLDHHDFVYSRLRRALGRDPMLAEVAAEMGVEEPDLKKWLLESHLIVRTNAPRTKRTR